MDNFSIGAMKAEAIRKAFGIDIEKGRTGVYEDNAENRRLNRVGQPYGHKKQEEAPKGRQAAKQEEPTGDKRGAAAEATPVAKHAEGASDEALKRAAADPKAPEDVKAAAEAEMKKRGSGGGEEKEAKSSIVSEKKKVLKDFKRISSDELWNNGYDAGDAKEIYFKSSDNEDEIILINEDGSVTHDKVNTDEGGEDLKEYKSFDEFASEVGGKLGDKGEGETGDVDLTLDEVANILDVDGDMREVVLDYFSREPAWAEEHGATKEQMEFCEKLEKLGAKISPKTYDWSEAEKAEAYERRMNKKGYEMFNVYDGDMYIWLMVPSDKLKN